MLIDSHAHLDGEGFADDLPEVLARARLAGVTHVVNIVSPVEPDGIARLRAGFEGAAIGLSLAAGLHPHDASKWGPAVQEALESRMPECVAWGEIGLDYHYDHAPRERQRHAFEAQLALARKHGKPVVIHTREADDDTLAILRDAAPFSRGGVIHCFTSGPGLASGALDLGLSISLSGIVTFKNAASVREVAATIPADRLMIETDCPYLAPVPHRGGRNEPAYVAAVAACVAGLRAATPADLALIAAENSRRLFGIEAA